MKPVAEQDDFESRRLWREVTYGLKYTIDLIHFKIEYHSYLIVSSSINLLYNGILIYVYNNSVKIVDIVQFIVVR